MHQTQLLERVQALGAFTDPAVAERAVEMTLGALGAALHPEDRHVLSDAIPARLRPFLNVAHPARDVDLPAFYSRIERQRGLRPGIAREQAQVVCRALAELSRLEVVSLLMARTPHLAALFELPDVAPPPDAPERAIRSEGLAEWAELASRTLAGRRPG